MKMTQQQLADELAVGRALILNNEKIGDDAIPRWLYLACNGLEQEIRLAERGEPVQQQGAA